MKLSAIGRNPGHRVADLPVRRDHEHAFQHHADDDVDSSTPTVGVRPMAASIRVTVPPIPVDAPPPPSVTRVVRSGSRCEP